MNCRIVLAFVSMTDSMINFPAASRTATEIVAVCTSMPMYLLLFTEGAPLVRKPGNESLRVKQYQAPQGYRLILFGWSEAGFSLSAASGSRIFEAAIVRPAI